MSTTVPFGKYKGRPVEDMLADAEYMAWLEAQPWFRERFKGLLANRDADAASRTPVHNRLQAMFLNEGYCRAFASVADPQGWRDLLAFGDKTVAEAVAKLQAKAAQLRGFAASSDEKALREEARANEPAAKEKLTFGNGDIADMYRRNAESERARAEKYRQGLAEHLAHAARSDEWRSSIFTASKFEAGGADVAIRILATQAVMVPSSYGDDPEAGQEGTRLDYSVEIKPVVSDDYPAVLRQMGRNGSKYLFVDRYAGEGATEAQFIAIFAASGIKVVFKRDVDAAVQL